MLAPVSTYVNRLTTKAKELFLGLSLVLLLIFIYLISTQNVLPSPYMLRCHGSRNASNTTLIVHGFHSKSLSDYEQISSLIQSNTSRVCILDWRSSAALKPTWWVGYAQALVNAHYLAPEIAEKLGPNNSVSCIGFSLGAHFCGFISREFDATFGAGLFERIIALDASGPRPDSAIPLLSRYDASYVVALHTNAGSLNKGRFGSHELIGHADFFVNDGTNQPNCKRSRVTCSHFRAVELFIESFKCRLVGLKCTSFTQFASNTCVTNAASEFSLTMAPANGKFYIRTEDTQPYCKNVVN